METADVISVAGGQAVMLPEDYRFSEAKVLIRKAGDAVILEPLKAGGWKAGFFKEIRIDDSAFSRPDQGTTPPAPSFD